MSDDQTNKQVLIMVRFSHLLGPLPDPGLGLLRVAQALVPRRLALVRRRDLGAALRRVRPALMDMNR